MNLRTLFYLFLMISPFLSQSQNLQFSELSILPKERSAITSATDGQNIYVANGFGINEPYAKEIYQYNISSDTWSLLTDLSVAKRFASAAIIDNNLYVFNGALGAVELNSNVEVIDLNDGTITLSTINPQPARAAGVSTWNGKIYSFGGTTSPNVYSNKLYEFNPQTEIWTELATMPISGETKGEIINGKLYVFGGYNGNVSNRIDIYDITTDTWETELTMPSGISAHATAIVGTTIYLVGDYNNLNSLASFETTDNSFTTLNSNLNNRRHCAAEGIDGKLIAIGGNTTSSIESSISSVQIADILSKTVNINDIAEIKLFPNPTSDLLKWGFQFDFIRITNLHGKEIESHYGITNQLNVKHFPQGIYFLIGKSNDKWYRSKWVKN